MHMSLNACVYAVKPSSGSPCPSGTNISDVVAKYCSNIWDFSTAGGVFDLRAAKLC